MAWESQEGEPPSAAHRVAAVERQIRDIDRELARAREQFVEPHDWPTAAALLLELKAQVGDIDCELERVVSAWAPVMSGAWWGHPGRS